MQHQTVARQEQTQGALRGRQQRAIDTDQPAALEQAQLILRLYSTDQALIERPQRGNMQPGARLGQGAVRDQIAGTRAQARQESIQPALHAGAAKAHSARRTPGWAGAACACG